MPSPQSHNGKKSSSLRGSNEKETSSVSERKQSAGEGHSDNDKDQPAYKKLLDQTRGTEIAVEDFLRVLTQRMTDLENDRDFKEIKRIPISVAKYASSKPKVLDHISEELKLWQEAINATSAKLSELTARMEADKERAMRVITNAFDTLKKEK